MPVVSYKRRFYKVSYRHGSVTIMRWNSEERAFAVEAYFLSGCSVIVTQLSFRNRFNFPILAPVLDRKSIVTWVTTLRQTASATRRRTGVPRPIRSRENIEAVRALMLRSPRRSARKHASALGLSNHSVRRILHEDLHFHPYKMAIVQELYEWVFNSWGNTCEVLLEVVPEDAVVVFLVTKPIFICVDRSTNKTRYWADTNPWTLHERPLHSPKVTVWCAISSGGIIGPWFFEENEVTVTVNSDRYVNIFLELFFPRLDELDLGDTWFQQDGATAHTSRTSMAVLREIFPERLISIRGDLEWPAALQIWPLVCFLWVFSMWFFEIPCLCKPSKNPTRFEDSHPGRNCQHSARYAGRSHDKRQKSVYSCMENGGRHILDVIFKTKLYVCTYILENK